MGALNAASAFFWVRAMARGVVVFRPGAPKGKNRRKPKQTSIARMLRVDAFELPKRLRASVGDSGAARPVFEVNGVEETAENLVYRGVIVPGAKAAWLDMKAVAGEDGKGTFRVKASKGATITIGGCFSETGPSNRLVNLDNVMSRVKRGLRLDPNAGFMTNVRSAVTRLHRPVYRKAGSVAIITNDKVYDEAILRRSGALVRRSGVNHGICIALLLHAEKAAKSELLRKARDVGLAVSRDIFVECKIGASKWEMWNSVDEAERMTADNMQLVTFKEMREAFKTKLPRPKPDAIDVDLDA